MLIGQGGRGLPDSWQQLGGTVLLGVGDAGEDIGEPGLRIDVVEPSAIHVRLAGSERPFATARIAIALKPEAIAAAILHVISQAADVDTTENVVRPLANPY